MNNSCSSSLAENEQWQQYAKSEDFLSDTERRLQEWDGKQKADKKLAKPTHYGTLGVLIWATDAYVIHFAQLVLRVGVARLCVKRKFVQRTSRYERRTASLLSVTAVKPMTPFLFEPAAAFFIFLDGGV